jgi:ryanodine receptor 2
MIFILPFNDSLFTTTTYRFDSMDRQSSYMIRADELYSEVSQDPSGKAPSQGLFIGCFVDTSTGIVSFTCEGKETKQRFRMEPGTKLFPAVFVKATSKDALQVKLCSIA